MSEERTPTLAQGLGRAFRALLQNLHTAMPGEVVAYDAATQTADVRPLLRERGINEAGEVEQRDLPVLVRVPVVFPGGGGFRLTFPLQAGDGVLLVFAEGSLERWQPLGGVQDTDGRRHHIADAVAFAGLHADTAPWAGASSSSATIGSDTGPGVVFTPAGVELGARDGTPATEAVVLGNAYRSSEDAAIDAAVLQLTATAAAVTAAAASLGVAVPLNAVPIVGGILAAAPLAVVVTQLGVVASQLGAAIATLQAFKASAALTLSPHVKTR